jgi:Protein of unknown function (DUF1579)
MKTMRIPAMISAACLLLAAAALAQMEAPKPGPEHKKLDIFAGTWSMDGDFKPGAMGPGGKMSQTEKCEWMEGGFFLLCHTDFKSTMGNGSGVSIMGYSTDDKTYTYHEYNSWGEAMDSKGAVSADTWTWTSDEKMGANTMKGKFTMNFTSPTAYTFTFEMSQDGTKWTTVMDGKASKAK